MIDITIWVLTALDVIIALLLILLILIQQSKDGGFGSAFGGMGESVFGVQAASHLSKLTVIFAASFLFVTLFLAVITGHRDATKKSALEAAAAALEKAGTDADKTVEAAKKADQGQVKEDGSVVKKVPGGTITMKPVEQPGAKPEDKDGKTVTAPAGTVTVKPAEKTVEEESTEVKPDGTIVKKVKGGTITMKPVPKSESPDAKKPEAKDAPAGTVTVKPVDPQTETKAPQPDPAK